MDDVARLAGVAKMTVSRALRSPDKVAEETRRRVEDAMRTLGYVPNRIAGNLSAARSTLVAVIVPTIQHAIFAETVQGLSEILRPAGLQLLVADTGYSIEREDELVLSLLGHRPSAVVLTGTTRSETGRRMLARLDVPVVETWETTDTPVDMAVGYSNRAAGEQMTRALIDCGYRRIAFVNGPVDHNERALHREEGYGAAIRAAGLGEPVIHRIAGIDRIRYDQGREALAALLDRHADLDAVFFTNDVFAVGGVMECRARGIRVPDEIGIAGFHDLDVSQVCEPPVTTVHVPGYEIGRQAGDLIVRRLEGEQLAGTRVEIPFRLVMRASTARTAAAGRAAPQRAAAGRKRARSGTASRKASTAS